MHQFVLLNNAGDISVLYSYVNLVSQGLFSIKVINNPIENDDCHFRLLVCFDFESLRRDMFLSKV